MDSYCRKVAIICLFVAFISGSTGGAHSGPVYDEGYVTNVLNRIQNRYRSVGSFDTTFIQETFSPGGLTPDSVGKGTFVYRGPCKMAWKYEEPEKQIFVILPQVVWLFSIEQKQIQLFDPASLKNSALTRVLVEDIKKSFSIESYERVGDNAGGLVSIKLTPKDESSEIKEIGLTVYEATGKIRRVDAIDLVGRKNVITLINERSPGDPGMNGLFGIPGDPEITILDETGAPVSPDRLRSQIEKSKIREKCGQ